jgi:DNA-binding transcriptional regulator LsrR (DeoR family)
MDETNQRLAYLAHVASLYYDHGKNQQDIADELKITRSAVSRLLTEARQKGIVEIKINYPWQTNLELEKALLAKFKLKAARVLKRENKSYTDMLDGLGRLAAQYFLSILGNDMIVGISWGSALGAMTKVLRVQYPPKNIEVVQLLGATGSEKIAQQDGPSLAQMLSEALSCPCRYLHAPLIVDTPSGRETLMQDRSIRETLMRAEQAEIALVGIGSTNPELYSLLRAGYVDRREVADIINKGAVGDVCAHHFDIEGNYLDIDINKRVVGIIVDTLFKIPTVIGVAGDVRKSSAILGALRGNYINVLITDDEAAQKVLELNDSI